MNLWFFLDRFLPVWQLRKVPRRFPLFEEAHKPDVLSCADGVKVEHEEDSGRIALRIEAEKELAELKRRAIACSGTNGQKVPK